MDELFADYEKFEKTVRSGRSMTEYISEFEKARIRLKNHKLKIPDQLLACKLLYCAELDDRDKKLMLTATADLTFGAMKTNLKRVFSSSMTTVGIDSAPLVKEETVFSADSETALWVGRGKNFRGKGLTGASLSLFPENKTEPTLFEKMGRCRPAQCVGPGFTGLKIAHIKMWTVQFSKLTKSRTNRRF